MARTAAGSVPARGRALPPAALEPDELLHGMAYALREVFRGDIAAGESALEALAVEWLRRRGVVTE